MRPRGPRGAQLSERKAKDAVDLCTQGQALGDIAERLGVSYARVRGQLLGSASLLDRAFCCGWPAAPVLPAAFLFLLQNGTPTSFEARNHLLTPRSDRRRLARFVDPILNLRNLFREAIRLVPRPTAGNELSVEVGHDLVILAELVQEKHNGLRQPVTLRFRDVREDSGAFDVVAPVAASVAAAAMAWRSAIK